MIEFVWVTPVQEAETVIGVEVVTTLELTVKVAPVAVRTRHPGWSEGKRLCGVGGVCDRFRQGIRERGRQRPLELLWICVGIS